MKKKEQGPGCGDEEWFRLCRAKNARKKAGG
jgi:hypothetical protein